MWIIFAKSQLRALNILGTGLRSKDRQRMPSVTRSRPVLDNSWCRSAVEQVPWAFWKMAGAYFICRVSCGFVQALGCGPLVPGYGRASNWLHASVLLGQRQPERYVLIRAHEWQVQQSPAKNTQWIGSSLPLCPVYLHPTAKAISVAKPQSVGQERASCS